MRYFLDSEFAEDGRTLDLISIGIVCEDGREYYAQSAEFLEHGKPNRWVQAHVIPHLGNVWKERGSIKREIREFMDVEKYGKPELWGYYSAYDHVVFCQIFGTMMDLPKGFPMLTYDLRQLLDMQGMAHITQPETDRHHALDDARWIAHTFTHSMHMYSDEEEDTHGKV